MMSDAYGGDHDPTVDPLKNPGVRGTYSLWHRLASEALVYVSERKDPSRDIEMLKDAQICGERAMGMAVNDIQEKLTGKLLEAVTGMRQRLGIEL